MEKELMRTNYMTLETFTVKLACGFASGIFCLLLVVLLLLVAGFAGSSFAQDSQPKTFSSPEEASGALFQAVQNEDEPSLEAILGAGKEVTSSSDEVQDKLEREKFCQKYREMRRLVGEADGTTVLYIGAENWPFPIPLVSKNGAWYFDSKTGIQEIKFRRSEKTRPLRLKSVVHSQWQRSRARQKMYMTMTSSASMSWASSLPVQRILEAMSPLPSTDTTFEL